MKIIIPTNLQDKINFIIDSNPRFTHINQIQKTKLIKTLISLWYYIYESQRYDNTILNLKGFTQISSMDLKKFNVYFNKDYIQYKDLLNLLSEEGTIEVNNKFNYNKFSKSYRISTDYISNNYTEVEIDFDKVLYKIRNKSHWIRKYPEYKKLIDDVYDVRIDLDEYIHWINNNIGLQLKSTTKNGVLVERYLTKERAYDYINDALKINFKNIWIKISDEGRFYNSTTNLSYTALPFLKLKGRKVVECDVINCQPLLLCGVIKNKLYQKDVEDGIFYENVANELNILRDEFKLLSYKYIFFSTKELKSGKIYDALEKLYPNFISDMNVLRNEINISRKMQELESSIFVKKIGFLDFKMMLRHDAVFVYEEDMQIIKKHIIHEFKSIGLNAKLK